MGSSVGVHPLLVIFALLAGAQIGGILGMIASLPLLAMLKHSLTYYDFKMSKAPWAGDDGIVLIPAKSAGPPPRRVRPPGAPEETAADETLWSDAAPVDACPAPAPRRGTGARAANFRRAGNNGASSHRRKQTMNTRVGLWCPGDAVTIAICRG